MGTRTRTGDIGKAAAEGSARVFGIVGRPLGHSFSRAFFEAKFAAEGLSDCRFENFELASIGDLPALVAARPELRGFSVTIPYKVAILPLLASISPEAAAVGAVNCVRVDGGLLHGYNTDVHGFAIGLERLSGGDVTGVRALVLGTGGASRAVQYVLGRRGVDFRVVSRNAAPGGIVYADLTPAIVREHSLVVNCSPLGTWPDLDGKPELPYGAIGPSHFLYDLVYNPAETAFLREGRTRGAATINGLPMLHSQAEKSWEIWTF